MTLIDGNEVVMNEIKKKFVDSVINFSNNGIAVIVSCGLLLILVSVAWYYDSNLLALIFNVLGGLFLVGLVCSWIFKRRVRSEWKKII